MNYDSLKIKEHNLRSQAESHHKDMMISILMSLFVLLLVVVGVMRTSLADSFDGFVTLVWCGPAAYSALAVRDFLCKRKAQRKLQRVRHLLIAYRLAGGVIDE